MLGLLESKSGEAQAAVETFDKALELIQRATQNGIGAEASSLNGALQSNQGLALQDLGRDAEAIIRFESAINRQKFALTFGDKEQYRLYLRNHYAAKCDSLARLKEHERLAEAAKHLPEPLGAWRDWRHAAERLALCVKLARDDQTLSNERREKLVAQYRTSVVGYLSKAIAAVRRAINCGRRPTSRSSAMMSRSRLRSSSINRESVGQLRLSWGALRDRIELTTEDAENHRGGRNPVFCVPPCSLW